MTMKLNLKTFNYIAFTVAVFSPVVGWAQYENIMPPMRGGGTNPPTRLRVNIDAGYTETGKAKFLGTKSGDSGAANMNVSIFAPQQLNEKWTVPLGLVSENLELDTISGVPVPEEIHTLSLKTGLRYRLNEEWMITGLFSPTLYKFSDVGGNDIGFSGGVSAMWRYSDSLTWMFGAVVSPDSEIPALPLVGVDWRINEEWDLRLMFPQPRVIFRPDEHWSFHAGASFVQATFRSDDTLGTSIGRPQYNDALASYRDIRLGVGAGYSLNKSLRVEVEAGYSVNRQIAYKDFETVEFESAPYLRFGLNFGF